MKRINIDTDAVIAVTAIVGVLTLIFLVIHWALATGADNSAKSAKDCAAFDKAVASIVVDHPQEALALSKLRGNICI